MTRGVTPEQIAEDAEARAKFQRAQDAMIKSFVAWLRSGPRPEDVLREIAVTARMFLRTAAEHDPDNPGNRRVE